MYNTIITRPERFEDKIRYELNKFLPMRLDKMTMQAVKELDRELVPEVAVAIEQEPQVVEGEQANDENGRLLLWANVLTITSCLRLCATSGTTTANDGSTSRGSIIRC